MSMPYTIIECDTCDFTTSNTVTWGRFAYSLGDRELDCNRQLGWCDDCETAVAMEDFSIGDYLAKIRKLLDITRDRQSSWFSRLRNLLTPNSWGQVNYWVQEIEEQISLIDFAMDRSGTERCLRCGSRCVSSIVLPQMTYDRSPISTAREHPGCGGMLLAKPSDGRLIMAFVTKRIYSEEGTFIGEIRCDD